MSAIPTLIVAPAIVAAGIAYRYSGGSERNRRGSTSRLGQRNEEMSSGFDNEQNIGQNIQRQQHINEYIPTTMVGGGLSRFDPQGTNSLATQTGKSNYHSEYRGEKDTFPHYHPAVITTKEHYKPLIPSFPRTDKERQQESWFSRLVDKVTGNLGPIEHQDEMRRTFNPARDSDQYSETDRGFHMKGSPYSSKTIPGADSTGPRPTLARSSKNTSDAPLNAASRAADDVTYKGVDDVDANRAGINVTRQDEKSRSSGIWSEGDKYDIDPSASETAMRNSKGWFSDKKQDADQVASNTAGSMRQGVENAADNTRGWFWDKKQDVDQTATNLADSTRKNANETAGSVKQGVQNAADTTKQAADNTRGWFWNKKQDIDQTAANVAGSARQEANQVTDTAKQAAEDTREWFWNKKEETGQAAANAADATKQVADETRNWIGRKEQDASETASNAAANVKGATNAAVEGTEDWLRAKKNSAEAAAGNALGSAQDTAADARDWVKDTSSEVGQNVANAAGSAVNAAERTGDQSRAWLWGQKSKADQKIADAASNVELNAGEASVRAQEAANNAQKTANQRGSPRTANSLQQTIPEDSRSSSLMTSTKGDGIMQALDDRVDEARAALRATGNDLRSMAERARPQPTNEGFVPVGGKEIRKVGGIAGTSADNSSNRAAVEEKVKLRLVENNSGIPVLSSGNYSK
ncbi:hypothetical protein COEREDRAFT_89505 [Coemansia reversa NRRL 1564]|uniref:Uncharacterized protein n=1 Tax=Coemansia reversa (strain ATCC 12441 / NRRL 1564) TaxID=763665 RepID=A0A2G5B3D5_COERN|nr:hypothetical protein COEREDRAFT_89505 [Coemansia reversa NRRL 1564]|eukprot:PIA13529.1 hypothetical protein COEREDRAFT_89505 [Coemansia reversa NRRL 1564]